MLCLGLVAELSFTPVDFKAAVALNQRFKRVRELQSLYHLALGQTNQQWLIKQLREDKSFTEEKAKKMMIDLRPGRK
jgi:hypothetical protein